MQLETEAPSLKMEAHATANFTHDPAAGPCQPLEQWDRPSPDGGRHNDVRGAWKGLGGGSSRRLSGVRAPPIPILGLPRSSCGVLRMWLTSPELGPRDGRMRRAAATTALTGGARARPLA
eukprot:RCo014526